MSLLEDFQKQLRYRLSLKRAKNESDETCLFKILKYFDIQNREEIDFKQFLKAMERLGLQSMSENELTQVFDAYDTNRNGMLDYKEFSALLCRQSSIASSSYLSSTSYSQRPSTLQSSEINFPQTKNLMSPPYELLKTFKQKVKQRGIKGILGLQRIFKLIDNDNSGEISLQEFKKALKEYKLDSLQDQETINLFNLFDRDRDGEINYNEFIKTLTGELNDFRRDIVERVFIILDKHNEGTIDSNEMKAQYNAKRHPEVMEGKKSEQSVQMEFLETFDQHHALTNARSSRITLQEFQGYYSIVGSTIDSDEYFSIMMNNVWNVNGNSFQFQALSLDDNSSVYKYMDNRPGTSVFSSDSSHQNMRGQYKTSQSSQDNPLAALQTQKYYKAQEDSNKQKQENHRIQNQPLWEERKYNTNHSQAASMRSERSCASSVYHSEKIPLAKYQTIYVERFKKKLFEQGIKGLINLRNEFRILDENCNGTLSFQEFFSVIKKFKVDIPDVDIKNAFKAFDMNKNGEIEYEEFAKVLIGPMSKLRASYVEKAFNKIDIHQQGFIDIDYIIKKYDPKRHPDYLNGKKTADQVKNEFKETFTVHHQVMHGYQALDDKISKYEFIDYYAHVSSVIENDSAFIQMIEGVWNLDNKDNFETLPFAGSKNKVLTVDHKQKYLEDTFKRKFLQTSVPYGTSDDDKSSMWSYSKK